jgi:hypothetical protein
MRFFDLVNKFKFKKIRIKIEVIKTELSWGNSNSSYRFAAVFVTQIEFFDKRREAKKIQALLQSQ